MATNKINNDREMLDRAIAKTGRSMVPPGCEPAGPGAISVWVAGTPAPQGSKRALGAGRPGGKIRMIESSKKVKPWREDVRQGFLNGGHREVNFAKDVPVVVKIVFVLPRTVAMRQRPSLDYPMVQKPDVDKLGRAVLDALKSAGVYADDSQVVTLLSHKRRAEPGEPTGAMIHIESVTR
jgi:crossover junction endodeoxyribonuclease RusA